jgi:hypothetical protein
VTAMLAHVTSSSAGDYVPLTLEQMRERYAAS